MISLGQYCSIHEDFDRGLTVRSTSSMGIIPLITSYSRSPYPHKMTAHRRRTRHLRLSKPLHLSNQYQASQLIFLEQSSLQRRFKLISKTLSKIVVRDQYVANILDVLTDVF